TAEVGRRKNSHHRSLDLEAFNIHVAPTTSEINLPTIIRLYPPTAKPLQLSGNMPLRFGRDDGPSSNNHLPLRFGRCLRCSNAERQLQGLYWSLKQTGTATLECLKCHTQLTRDAPEKENMFEEK
uniref:Uncharacterized protein n=1 Tax=Neogobius melanostomus TaxID=47308 RepID=A0A8C6T573_9GOBI